MSKGDDNLGYEDQNQYYPHPQPPQFRADPDIDSYPVKYNMRDRRYQQKDEGTEFLKYTLFTYNLVFFLCACTLLGIGIWMAVDRSFMATITGEPLYAVAIYIMLAGAAIMFIIAFLACCGAISENKLMLWIFFAVLAFILFVLVLSGILAIVFRTQIGEAVQDTMRDTLRENYGIDLYDRKNKAITSAWDKAQEKLHCCAVDTEGWLLYRESKWYETYGQDDEEQVVGTDTKKSYVPRSCCLRDRFGQYTSLDHCQKWEFGPPKQQSGAVNRALYYEGCYEAGKRYLMQNSDIIIGLGFCFAVVVVVGLIFSFLLIRKL